MAKKPMIYKRRVWRLAKAWSRHDSSWKYSIQWKSTFLWFTTWAEIDQHTVHLCKWDEVDEPGFDVKATVHRGDATVYFDSEQDARRFIEFFEEYRKKMFSVYNELTFDRYIMVD